MDCPDGILDPSGIVKSWIKVRLFVQVGVGVGILIVGIVVGNAFTTTGVFGMSCTDSVGGTKNTGVAGGVQAPWINRKTNNIASQL